MVLVVLGILTACEVDPRESGSLLVVAMAAPTCPVETDPPDPQCAPRPVAGALVVVSPADGRDVIIAQGETGEDGQLTLTVPAGDYLLTGGEVEGLMGAPQPVLVSVVPGITIEVGLAYDTGIR